MCAEALLDLPDSFVVRDYHRATSRIFVEVEAQCEEACCPVCEEPTDRIHSRYTRALRDLPVVGKAVRITLHLRRFRCLNDQCSRKIFCERIPRLAKSYAHCTERLQQAHADIARSAGAEGGSRLARRLGMSTSADTLLRRLQRLPIEAP